MNQYVNLCNSTATTRYGPSKTFKNIPSHVLYKQKSIKFCVPGQNLAIGEPMTLLKMRLSLKMQSIKITEISSIMSFVNPAQATFGPS